MTYKLFLEEFEKSLPKFMQSRSREISDDIIDLMKSALEKDGLEIRGKFSMNVGGSAERKTVKFKDLTKTLPDDIDTKG